MRIPSIGLTTIAILVASATGHPFFILSTSVPATSASHNAAVSLPRPTPVRVLPGIIHPKRQGLLDPLISAVNSALGIDQTTTSNGKQPKTSSTAQTSISTSSQRTIPAATTASSTTSSGVRLPPPVTTSGPTSTSSSTDDSNGSSTSTTDSSTSTSDSSTSTSTTSSTTSIISPSSTNTVSATTTTTALSGISPTTTATPISQSNGNSVPGAGIAIAVILVLAIIGTCIFLYFRYSERGRAWWVARQDRAREQRSFRDALDGPHAGSKSNLRERALCGSEVGSKRSTMFSFFAPATVKLGNGQEIRRKPVNWGAPPTPTIPSAFSNERSMDEEKMSIISSAAPIAGTHNPPEVVELAATTPQPKPISPIKSTASTKKDVRKSHVNVFEMPVHEEVSRPSIPSTPKTQALAELNEIPNNSVPSVSAVSRATSKASMLSSIRPVSPMTLRSDSMKVRDRADATPISPLAGRAEMPTISEARSQKELPMPPTLPFASTPGVVVAQRAQRGSDGVFRLG